MIIHNAKQEPCQASVDVSKGAVTFHPWPFSDEKVRMKDSYHFSSEDGLTSFKQKSMLTKDAINTLATATDGAAVLMLQRHWILISNKDGDK